MTMFGWGDIEGTPFPFGYNQILDEGLPLAPATTIDFVGGGVTATNGVGKTLVTIQNPIQVYTQTASSTPITNTTTETNLLDGGLGSLTVPANGFKVGDSFLAVMTGILNSANNQPIRIRVKSLSVLLADTGSITLPQCTNQHFTMSIYFIIRALGGAGVGSIATGGNFSYNKDSNFAIEGRNFSTENSTTFDTTINNTLLVTAQWTNANPNNTIYSQIFTLTKTY